MNRKRNSASTSSFQRLESRNLLTVGNFAGNDCPPDLDLSGIETQTVEVGETLTFDLFDVGAIVTDVDNAGVATNDAIRLLLDPDIPGDNPAGATLTSEGQFSWTPTEGQEGTFEIIVIAVDSGQPRLGDAETFTVVVGQSGNDSPIVDLNGDGDGIGSTAVFTEDDGPVSVFSNAVISDADSEQLTVANVVITNRQNGAVEVLIADTSGTSIAQSFDAASGVLTLSGADLVANYQQVLQSVTYDNPSQNPGDVTRELNVIVSDGFDNSELAVAQVVVIPINDVSVIDLNGDAEDVGFSAVFTQDGGPVSIVDADNATIVDADSTTLDSATIQIVNPFDGAGEVLAVDTTGTSIEVDLDPLEGILRLEGVDTIENYQAVLRTLTYENISSSATPGDRSVLISVGDGIGQSAQRISTIQIVVSTPSLDLNGDADGTGFVAEFNPAGGPVSILGPELTVSDNDNANLQSATIALVNAPNGALEVLDVDTTGTAITAEFTAATGLLQLTGTDSVENYQSVLSTLTYDNTATDVDPVDRRIRLTVNDGSSDSNTAVTTVEIGAVSAPPQLTLPAPFNGAGPISINTGELTQFTADVTDSDSSEEQLTFALDLDNSGLPITAVMPTITSPPSAIPGGDFSFTPDTPGTFEIIVVVTDQSGNADQESFTVTVSDTDAGLPSAFQAQPFSQEQAFGLASVIQPVSSQTESQSEQSELLSQGQDALLDLASSINVVDEVELIFEDLFSNSAESTEVDAAVIDSLIDEIV